MKLSEGIQGSSYDSGTKFFGDPAKLLPLSRFTNPAGIPTLWPVAVRWARCRRVCVCGRLLYRVVCIPDLLTSFTTSLVAATVGGRLSAFGVQRSSF